MTTMTASKARASLYGLLRTVAKNHTPVQITGKDADAVLVSQEDWSAIQETLHLLSIPGMRESLREGLAMPIGDCSKELVW